MLRNQNDSELKHLISHLRELECFEDVRVALDKVFGLKMFFEVEDNGLDRVQDGSLALLPLLPLSFFFRIHLVLKQMVQILSWNALRMSGLL